MSWQTLSVHFTTINTIRPSFHRIHIIRMNFVFVGSEIENELSELQLTSCLPVKITVSLLNELRIFQCCHILAIFQKSRIFPPFCCTKYPYKFSTLLGERNHSLHSHSKRDWSIVEPEVLCSFKLFVTTLRNVIKFIAYKLSKTYVNTRCKISSKTL